jgi:hypothetical protein
MHTLKVIVGGFALLGLCLLMGHFFAGSPKTMVVPALKCFLALWLIATLVNLWIGVTKAGYSIKDEAPIALVIFAVPAAVAAVIWWRLAAA